VESLILFEARPCAGETDAEIVAGAWDFTEINRRYAVHKQVLARRPKGHLGSKAAAARFQYWLRDERPAPSEYAGINAWRNRIKVMSEAGKQMRTFRAK
jgi:hypothetical protein